MKQVPLGKWFKPPQKQVPLGNQVPQLHRTEQVPLGKPPLKQVPLGNQGVSVAAVNR